MQVLTIGGLLLLIVVLVTSSRPARPQIVLLVEEPSHPNGCLVLLVLAIVTFLAVSR
jgi:hypothetical protein